MRCRRVDVARPSERIVGEPVRDAEVMHERANRRLELGRIREEGNGEQRDTGKRHLVRVRDERLGRVRRFVDDGALLGQREAREVGERAVEGAGERAESLAERAREEADHARKADVPEQQELGIASLGLVDRVVLDPD